MFGLGMAEILVICVIGLLLFGNRLPGVARSLGKSLMEFRKELESEPRP
jgi:sec-independent protein translocase protein TatA